MKKPRSGDNWFFVDESGDATFYDRKGNLIVGHPGCSPVLMLGFIETQDPDLLRKAVIDVQREVVNDPYFQDVPSLKKTAITFHAKDDTAEIRYIFFKLISELDFKAQFIIARKIERVFRNNFEASKHKFYDHLIQHLFERVLHRYTTNHIYFAKRGSRDRQQPLEQAIQTAIRHFEAKWNTTVESNYDVQAQTPKGEPCLSIIDYMNWAVYRAFTRGEMRYYRYVENKVSLLVDLYDRDNYPNNWYSRKNPFDITKCSPL